MTEQAQTVTLHVLACQETLAALEAKRAELVARGEKLPELRRGAAFAAHVEGNEEARNALDAVNVEVATHASELASAESVLLRADKLIE
jgi:hypothetical protein